MLTLVIDNAFAAMGINYNLTDCQERICIDLKLNDNQLLSQLRDNYQNTIQKHWKYDVESMQRKFDENKNIVVAENDVDLKREIKEQARAFEKIRKLIKSEKVRNYIAFIQVLNQCVDHLLGYGIDLCVDNQFVITEDLEDKIIDGYLKSTKEYKQGDKKVQYFLRLAKYF